MAGRAVPGLVPRRSLRPGLRGRPQTPERNGDRPGHHARTCPTLAAPPRRCRRGRRTTDRGLPTCWRTRDLAGDRERLAERRGLLGERRPTQRRARRTPRRTDRGTGLTAALVPESSVPLVHWATRSPPVYPRLPTGE